MGRKVDPFGVCISSSFLQTITEGAGGHKLPSLPPRLSSWLLPSPAEQETKKASSSTKTWTASVMLSPFFICLASVLSTGTCSQNCMCCMPWDASKATYPYQVCPVTRLNVEEHWVACRVPIRAHKRSHAHKGQGSFDFDIFTSHSWLNRRFPGEPSG